MEKTDPGKKIIRVYKESGDDLPVLYSSDYAESGNAVLKYCREFSCPPFHLVTISGLDWESEMSPWPSEPVVRKDDTFRGKGPEYLQWLLTDAVPYAEKKLGVEKPVSFLAGYSMAGLFALWTLYQTDFFKGAVCASGSLWYPGFDDFAAEQELKGRPQGIYLSLGEKESSVRNPVLQRTEAVYQKLEKNYREKKIRSIYERNPGNHYTDPEKRLAKGITWLLSEGPSAGERQKTISSR